MNEREMFVLEWSAQQKAFHIQLLDEALRANRMSFDRKRGSDWVPLFIGTYRECEVVARHNDHKLEQGEKTWTH